MAEDATARRYRASFQDEVDSATVYRAIADAESSPELAEVYRNLADAETRHADFWAERMEEAGVDVPPRRPSWRARTLAWLAGRFGPGLVLSTLDAAEVGDSGGYAGLSETGTDAMAAEEASHARLLRAIEETGAGGVEGGVLARLEGRHRSTSGNALRAAVLGANDGLVSNLSLVMGVAGAALSGGTILVTGLAGLLAGAGSMAMGEWLSVQSSRELYEHQIAIEAEELAEFPEEEARELALIYRSKGLSEAEATELADRLVADQATALDTLAREELGVDPEELGGSALEAAGASFVLFAIGAIVPVLPFAVLMGTTAIVASLLLSATALFAVGAAITLLTGKGVLSSGGRQVLIGLTAAALTFAVGRLIGVAVVG